MRYADIKDNDCTNGIGVCVSFWAQGCPHHCTGCHNPETWDFNGGRDADEDYIISCILSALEANGVQRNLSLLGGEPLCPENANFIQLLIYRVKRAHPKAKIYCWSGYSLEQLQTRAEKEEDIKYILDNIDVLAAGPFILAERDITLPLVGSKNQQIWWKTPQGWSLDRPDHLR